MISLSRLQASRYELKYLIDERKAAAVRDFVCCYLKPDEFVHADGMPGYPVCSLYLDDRALSLYGQTIQKQKNRFKLRIRIYDDVPSNPAFAEIKRREGDVIKKRRAVVSRQGALEILRRRPVTSRWLFPGSTAGPSMAALYEFCRLRDQIGAMGCTYVYYRREAYMGTGNDLRVTFDRQLQTWPFDPDGELRMSDRPVNADLDGVILELKFTNRFPNWMAALVKTFELHRQSIPKYVKCVDTLGIKNPADNSRLVSPP